MTEPVLVTIAEAARQLSTSTRTLHRWSAANIIGMRKIGGRWFVPSCEIRRLGFVKVGHDETPTDKPVAGDVTGQADAPTLEIVINQAVA
jgi:hypothetical protein